MTRFSRQEIVEALARDLPVGSVVNLGIGLPTMVVKFIRPEQCILLHSENGILGMVPLAEGEVPDADLIDASKQPVALIPGASICDHVVSFSMMRGGHLDFSVLGAYEVAANGDLANWSLGGNDPLPSVGGAMDLAIGAGAVWVVMESQTKDGRPRLVEKCSLPLTGQSVVRRAYTDIGIFDLIDGCFVPRHLPEGWTENDLMTHIAAPVRMSSVSGTSS